MPLQIIRNDITQMNVDAIVNAANKTLLGGGGVDGAIHRAAGPELLEECRRLGGCRTGEAKITAAYRLPCRYVIHTVGPVWLGGLFGEKEKLASCYRQSLALARKHGCHSVAFPLISAGAYGYPGKKAVKTAVDAISAFLLECDEDMLVYLVVYSKEAMQISSKLFRNIRQYIDDHYVQEKQIVRERFDNSFAGWDTAPFAPVSADMLEANAGSTVNAFPDADEQMSMPFAPVSADMLEANAGSAVNAFPDAGEQVTAPFASVSADMLEANADSVVDASRDAGEQVTAPFAPVSADMMEASAGSSVDAFSDEDDWDALTFEPLSAPMMAVESCSAFSLEDALNQLDESFSQMVLRKIREKGMKNAECYKKANLDKKLFSKINNDIHYKPKKATAVALAIALEMDLSETRELLMKAGFALSHSDKFDIIVEYFIKEGRYDVFEINEVLFYYDQPLLGCVVA